LEREEEERRGTQRGASRNERKGEADGFKGARFAAESYRGGATEEVTWDFIVVPRFN